MPSGKNTVTIDFVGKDKMGAVARKVSRELKDVGTRITALDGMTANPEIKADLSNLNDKLAEVRAELTYLDGKEITPEVSADIAKAEFKFKAIQAEMRKINGQVLHVKVDVDKSKTGLLGKAGGLLGGAGGGVLKGLGPLGSMLTSAGGGLGPLLSQPEVLAGALAAVTAGAAAATTGIAAALNMALSLGTALGAAAGGAIAIKLALSHLDLTKAGKSFEKFEKRMKGVVRGFQKTAQRNILPGLERGIKGLGRLAGPARHAWSGITRGLGTEFARLGNRLGRNPAIKRFLNQIGKQAPGVFRKLGNIIYHVISIVAKLFSAFGGGKGKSDPLKSVAGGLGHLDRAMKPAKMRVFVGDVRALAKVFMFVAKVVVLSIGLIWKWIFKGIDAAIHYKRTWHAMSNAVASAWHAITHAVGSAIHAVGSAISRGWHAVVSATSSAWHDVTSAVASGFHAVMGWIGRIPGQVKSFFTGAADWLVHAGTSIISGLVHGISSAASGMLKGALSHVTSMIPDWKGPRRRDLRLLRPAGRAIIEGLVHGIKHHMVPLRRVLNAVTGYIKRHIDKLKGLASARKGVISEFRGMSSNVFGQDLSVTTTSANGVERTRRATAGSMVGFQRGSAHKAQRLLHDIRKLRREGISDHLLRQMMEAGESGWDNIHTLAQGSRGQVRALNRADAATQHALTLAGRAVGTSLYADKMHEQRRDIRRAEHLAKVFARELDRHQRKHVVVEVRIDGRHLHTSLLRHKRRTGGKRLGLG